MTKHVPLHFLQQDIMFKKIDYDTVQGIKHFQLFTSTHHQWLKWKLQQSWTWYYMAVCWKLVTQHVDALLIILHDIFWFEELLFIKNPKIKIWFQVSLSTFSYKEKNIVFRNQTYLQHRNLTPKFSLTHCAYNLSQIIISPLMEKIVCFSIKCFWKHNNHDAYIQMLEMLF